MALPHEFIPGTRVDSETRGHVFRESLSIFYFLVRPFHGGTMILELKHILGSAYDTQALSQTCAKFIFSSFVPGDPDYHRKPLSLMTNALPSCILSSDFIFLSFFLLLHHKIVATTSTAHHNPTSMATVINHSQRADDDDGPLLPLYAERKPLHIFSQITTKTPPSLPSAPSQRSH